MQTTPPCAEGLRWHVFTNYATVSIETVAQFEEIMANITDIETGAYDLLPPLPLLCSSPWRYETALLLEKAKFPALSFQLLFLGS